MIELESISKKYKKTSALDNVSIQIQQNVITGIVGPNGSGKSTMLKIITGPITNYKGEVKFANVTQQQLSLASEEFGFPAYYTVNKVINVFSLLKKSDKKESRSLLELLMLSPHLSKTVRQLSQGLKQRLNILCALMGESEIIILDEPNTVWILTGLNSFEK